MITRTKLEHHISRLEEKHRKIDEQIVHLESIGTFEDTIINQYKKERLALKDEIEMNRQRLESM